MENVTDRIEITETYISSILIANRGEIASRIIRTCKKMGIRSIAVYSEADRNAPYVKEADSAILIGDSNPAHSYLDQDKIIGAAKQVDADAIHPGYGFLSENARFARRCEEENIIFIGPNSEAIEKMGSKAKAKSLMAKHQVPVIPGYEGEDQRIEILKKEAIKIGFPALLKASAGGGGKGMRIVNSENNIDEAILSAQREALSSFGDQRIIVEKYIASGRHIEFQIFGDKHGNIIHILERECTIQRRYQKIIEESPSPALNDALRAKMGEAAIAVARALKYDNAGTVEFLLNEKTGDYFFLEVNTRLQVEHPVTEERTGLDLVMMQINSAQGLPLSISQDDIKGNGYAIECRLYAEDVSNDFLPVTGKILKFEIPEIDGLRMETAIETGSEISMYYDPMIAKIIIWDSNRQAAFRKMEYALQHLVCIGLVTNQGLLLQLIRNKEVKKGNYNTHFIEEHLASFESNTTINKNLEIASIAACLTSWEKRNSSRSILKAIPSGWRNSFYEHQKETFQWKEFSIAVRYKFLRDKNFSFVVNDTTYEVEIISYNSQLLRLEINGELCSFNTAITGYDYYLHNEKIGNIHLQLQKRFPQKASNVASGGYTSPMPAQVIKVSVKEGQQVKEGDELMVLSSMKMENTILVNHDGIVEEVYVEEGSSVEAGLLLIKVSENNL